MERMLHLKSWGGEGKVKTWGGSNKAILLAWGAEAGDGGVGGTKFPNFPSGVT